ncbi:MAG: DUF7487 domain-containing protein [Nitrosopumilaceae archaeon]
MNLIMFSKQSQKLLEIASRKKYIKGLVNNPFYEDLLKETWFLPNEAKITQRLWHVRNNTTEIQKCQICTRSVLWYPSKGQYREYCSITCKAGAPQVREKIKQTCLEKYGAEHNWCSGTQSREKYKQTILNKYGVDNVSKNKKIREKQKQTCLRNWGATSPMQSKQVRERFKQTMLTRYGVEHALQKHLSQFCLEKIKDYNWLYHQYIVRKRTVSDIASELGIDYSSLANYLRRFNFVIRQTQPYSFKAIRWLEQIMDEQNVFIQHARNIGEYKIPNTRFRVDGYCQKTNTIYEFYGDYWHGNPIKFESDIDIFTGISAGELYQSTLKREEKIRLFGYNLITMWESLK